MPKKPLSISVMAHPSREEYFPYLRERLGNPPFSIDYESKGLWSNCRKTWLLHDPGALFHVVIQDDAIVCDNFRLRAEKVIEDASRIVGNKPFAISFYHGNKKDFADEAQLALTRGYTIRSRPGWGVAICLPTAVIPDLVRECDTFDEPQDDERITRFLLNHKMEVYFPMPSLIDHRTTKETPSLVGDHGEDRCAFAFIDADK
jgi:hypothetical protein